MDVQYRLVLTLGLLVSASVCHAQYGVMPAVLGATIGNMAASQARTNCLSGTPASASATAAARLSSHQTVQAYLELAQSGTPVDTLAVFSRKAKLREWIIDGRTGDPKLTDDPIARAAAKALGDPETFAFAGDKSSARGVWRVPAAVPGPAAGIYAVTLRQERQGWRILRLAGAAGDATPPTVGPYCTEPGDIEKYVAEVAAADAEKAARKAAKTQAAAK